MTQERKFAKNLTGPGSAARLRETVSVALRECSQQSKPKLVEPLDYETVIVKNRTLLHNDPHREMLLFPLDDVSQSTLPRRFRTVRCSVPPSAIQEATSLLVRECIKAYTTSWSVIHYKYTAYSGNYLHLPSLPKPEGLPEHVFEVDAEADGKDEESVSRLRPLHITKQGWLYKGPESGSETSIISFTRSFKRRYFYLKQQADTTYIMEFHKDDRKLEAKGAIFLDSATDVRRSSRRGKHSFEVQMQDKFYLFAAESESEVDEWVGTLKKVIMSNEATNGDRISRGEPESSPGKGENFRESLEHSMNPELQKYARETDSLLAQQRKTGRQKLFNIYPEIQKSGPDDGTNDISDVEVYKQHFGTRIIIRCEDFRLRLQANMDEDGHGERLSNPEPVFIALALYDAREGKKISEDFHFDPNTDEIRKMIPKEVRQATDMLNTVDGATSKQPDLNGLDETWLAYPKIAVFSVTKPSPDIYLVARIEKVLQGSISAATDPYMRTPDIRVGTKVHRQMRQYCARLGHYRMPLAWAARPVFKPYTQELDTYSDFVLYKQEGSKVSEEDLIKHLQDMKKPEKQGKWLPILGTLKVNMYTFKSTLTNTVTSALQPVKPFNGPNEDPPSLEVAEFVPHEGQCAQPNVTYTNHIYVYPRFLKYDGQKTFPKARNVACYVEIRDSDDEHAVPLKCIYGKPGGSIFTTCSTAAVLHHSPSPDFNEEVKILIPPQLHDRHHLVFSFFHVSCELSKTASVKGSSKKAGSSEVPVGVAWFPLLVNGRVNGGEHHIRVAMNLPPGYLSYEQLGMGKGAVGPDIRWVDGGRPLFKFNMRLDSTTYTTDQHMHNFFAHCQKMENSPTTAIDFETSNRLKSDTSPNSHPNTDSPYDREMLRQVKSLHAVDVSTLINFLPVLFNQLLRLLTRTNSDDVAINTVRVLIHAATEIIETGKPEILHSYVKYVFVTESVASTKQKSVHEELAKNLKATLRPTQADQLVIGKFLKHSWFFFDILIKSMAQHLLSTGRIKMARNERFPSSFQFHIQTLVQTLTSHITQKYKEAASETRSANTSLANFVKKCFTFMDRGFVFRLINMYIDNFSPGDPKLLHEYKFEFLQTVCNHEHFIQLNLPIMRKTIKNYKDLKHDYTLSDEFRQNHFLVGLLLHEVKMALNESRDIRKFAITTLRNLLAKHSFDNRYSTKAHQARIATLYLPFLTIILENKSRLSGKDSNQSTPSPASALANGDSNSMSVPPTPGHTTLSQPETPVRQAPSLPSYNSSVSLDSSMTPYSATSRLAVRDPGVFAMISGQATSMQNLAPGVALVDTKKDSHHGSSSSLASNASSKESSATSGTTGTLDRERERLQNADRNSMIIHPTVTPQTFNNQPPFILRYEKLNTQEIKDLLLCFLSIVKNLSEEILLGWFNNSSESDVLDFLGVLEICIQTFNYLGKKRIMNLCIIGDSKRAMTLPVKKGMAIQSYIRHSSAAYSEIQQDAVNGLSQAETDASLRANLEANLSSEVATVVLDVVCLYTNHFKDQLQFRDGANPIMEKVFDLHLHFMQVSQSEVVQGHAFGALRSFISKFPKVLFQGEASMCGKMCYEILRCCNSRLTSTRSEACALMYLLMRSNFEFSQRKSFTRTHLQMIISVSQLISDVVGLSNVRFTDSLSIINSYANNDKAMQRTVFPVEVKDLTKRIRTVLMATAQMKEHQNDPEMLVDLQYSLAKSYASTPELRRTWLEAMARIHMKHNDFSEAAHCYIHIAALVAEYLRRRGIEWGPKKKGVQTKKGSEEVFPQGCRAFKNISPNVEPEESGMRDDSGMQDVQYTEDHLTQLLEECATLLEKAERYELLGEVYRLIIPIYEKTRQYEKLAAVYGTLQKAYTKIVDVLQSGRRLLGKYFRVAFFGQAFFEEEDGKEYIYKEPKITGLTEICDRLKNMYVEKYGKGNVQLIMDSAKVNTEDLNPRLAYIQVTYVTPYFDDKELEDRQTDFERNNNIRRFMFETPFTKNGKPRGEIAEQYKRRTVLTTSHSFPYVKKRILVVYHKEFELTPIEVAIDGMQNKVADLQDVVSQNPPDLKKIQLKLQGSVSVQVNAGPIAYAEAFLADDKVHKYRRDKVATLKETFRHFVHICNLGLELNGRLISSDQYEYHESLRHNFRDLTDKLSDIFGEPMLEDDKQSSVNSHRGSVTVFNMISTTGNTSQV